MDDFVGESYLGAGFEVPEGASFEDDPVPLTQNEGHHDDHHHEQEERRQNGHDPQVAGWRLHHSYKQTNIVPQYLIVLNAVVRKKCRHYTFLQTRERLHVDVSDSKI